MLCNGTNGCRNDGVVVYDYITQYVPQRFLLQIKDTSTKDKNSIGSSKTKSPVTRKDHINWYVILNKTLMNIDVQIVYISMVMDKIT